jgi:hypothetical protein
LFIFCAFHILFFWFSSNSHFSSQITLKFSYFVHLPCDLVWKLEWLSHLPSSPWWSQQAIQSILRREGYPKPYEALRDLTRTNEAMTKELLGRDRHPWLMMSSGVILSNILGIIMDYHNPLCFTNWLCGVVCFRCAFRGHTQKAFEFHSPNTHNFSDSACWMGYQLLGESTILWTPWKWTTRSKLSSRKWRLTIMWATADARLTWKFHLPPTPGAKLPMFWMSQGLSIYKGMLQVSTFCLCVLFEAWEWWTVAWGSWLHIFMSR